MIEPRTQHPYSASWGWKLFQIGTIVVLGMLLGVTMQVHIAAGFFCLQLQPASEVKSALAMHWLWVVTIVACVIWVVRPHATTCMPCSS